MGFMFWIWIAIMIVAVIVEITTTNLTSIWFSVGALVALISNLFLHDELVYVQIGVFVVFSGAAILLLRPLINKRFKSNDYASNIDSLFGKTAIVVEKITPIQPGAIKIEGIEWTATNSTEEFEPGDLVTIVSVEGNRLSVERKEG